MIQRLENLVNHNMDYDRAQGRSNYVAAQLQTLIKLNLADFSSGFLISVFLNMFN